MKNEMLAGGPATAHFRALKLQVRAPRDSPESRPFARSFSTPANCGLGYLGVCGVLAFRWEGLSGPSAPQKADVKRVS